MATPGDRYVGLDVGTSSVKGVVVDERGAVVAEAERPLALEAPEPMAAEQDAESWWRASIEVLRELAAAHAGRPRAVGLTGQKHAFLPLDASRRPLSRAILWCDGRAVAESEEAERLVGRARLGRRAGAIALPGLLVPKWLRFRRTEPRRAERVRAFAFAKDWIRLRLCDVHATDRTEASASLLYDVGRKTWAPDLLAAFGVDPAWLPEVGRSSDVAARVSTSGAAATGLPAGTPVVFGAGDNEAAAIGCGAAGEGRVAVVLGTSGTVVAHAARRGRAGGIAWGRHAFRGGYAATGVVLSAGRALEWIRAAAFPRDEETDEVLAAAEASDPAEGPLVFLPSLAGERSPVPDPQATGAFVGLRPGHTRGHLARAVAEGVSLAVADIVDLLRGHGVPVSELRLTSGGARSPFWRALVGDACGLPVVAAGETSGPATGAAMLAARSTGEMGTLSDVVEAWTRAGTPPRPPDPRETERLRALLATARAARSALRRVGSPPREATASPPERARPGAA